MTVKVPPTSLVAFALLAASAFNLSFIGWHLISSLSSPPKTYSWRGHDYPETLPLPMDDLPQASLTVEESVHYPILGLPSDDHWFGLTSASYGYVRLGPDDRQFVVTMFHELHCMRLLNRAFSKEEVATVAHVKHCLAYIKQGALCAADLTLEEGNFEERDFERVRTGGHHVCRDWTAAYPVMDDNYFEWRNRTQYEAPLPPGYLPAMQFIWTDNGVSQLTYGCRIENIKALYYFTFSDHRIRCSPCVCFSSFPPTFTYPLAYYYSTYSSSSHVASFADTNSRSDWDWLLCRESKQNEDNRECVRRLPLILSHK